jgi:Zinc knuckle
MAPTSRTKGKAVLPPAEALSAPPIPTEHATPTSDEPGASQSLSQRSSSPTLDRNDVAQLIAEQLAISRIDTAKLIAEQVALALATLQTGNTQSAPEQGSYERQDTVISSVEPTSRQSPFRDGPMRGTDAQELSDGTDPTFEAWRLQILARFRDDPGWYNSEERKLDYMLRRTKGDAQIHMIAGMKDESLPGFFETAQDALANLRQALVNPQATREAQNQFRALRMGNSEAFAQFRTRFLLLAHESHLRQEDYRDELWNKITPALGIAVAAVEAQMATYDQLADCLLSTDINLRWLSRSTPKSELLTGTPKARRDRNQAGQFLPTSSALRIGTSPALDRLHDHSSSSSPNAARSGTIALPTRRSATPALNPEHAGDTCHNCGKVGHRSPNCTLPRAPRLELKEFQGLPESDSENDEHPIDAMGKDML